MNGIPGLEQCARALLCALVFALTSCGGSDDVAPPANQVGPAGGTVTGPNGTQVVVPAGALSAPVVITFTPTTTAPPMPAGLQVLGTIYDIGPSGTTFTAPVTVTLPLDPAQVPAGARLRMLHGTSPNAWEELPGLVVGTTSASAQTTSFTPFAMALGNSPPVVTPPQPVAQAVMAPMGASFSVSFTGTPPFDVQWERSNDGGTNWANAAASQTVITSPGTSTLTLASTSALAAATGGDNGALFRAAIRNIETPVLVPVLSSVVAMTVTSTPPTTATLAVTVVGSGSVTSAPAGIACGADCSEVYALNMIVTLTATPAAGFAFSAWSGDADCSDGSVTMSAARACTATFTATTGSLTGSWISNYQCTGTGGNFNGQDTLTVTQTGMSVSFSSSDGGSFNGTLSGNTMTYSGGGPGYTETGTWTMRGANGFTKTSNYVNTGGTGGSCPGAGQRQGLPFTLLVIVTGNGRVNDGSGGINLCEPASGDCTQAYPSGTQVTLSATGNAPGVVFNGWGAACFDVPSPLAARVVMDSSKTCTASFSP